MRIDEGLVADDFLPVNYNHGFAIYKYPVFKADAGAWAGGPIHYDKKEPLSIQIYNLGWELTCKVELNWAYLYEDNPLINKFISQLTAKGWKLETF